MDGDLSLSQSLGGLRIANPDDTPSPASHLESSDSIQDGSIDSQAISNISNSENAQTNAQLPFIQSDKPGRPLSQLDFDPSSYKSEDFLLSQSPATLDTSFLQRQHSVQRKEVGSGVTNGQAPGSSYPPGYPQAQRQNNMPVRAAPNVYGQPPAGPSLPARDPSYRLHRESSQNSLNSIPKRNGSRVSGAAMQAGVPSREGSYSDRSYRSVPTTNQGNGPFPPRRSSKGVPGVPGTLNGNAVGHEGIQKQNSDDWQERGAAVAVRPELDANGRPVLDANGRPVSRYVKKGVKDFSFSRTLGEGSYSTVVLGKDRQTGKEYAIKILDKRHIIKEKKVKYVNIEKDTLNRLTDHPGVVKLYYTFQDERSLYFVLDLASGGEMLGVLKRMTTFDEECTRFYGAQILDTIEYMHSRGVIHRDLKPENILMDDHMHTKITDFGTAKILNPPQRSRANSNGVPLPGDPDMPEENRAVSFVGTAEYVSPELLTDKSAGKASDLWAFGCIIYQLLAGRPPFKAANEYLTFQKIVALEYTFPRGFPAVARDLVERLLVLDPSRRLTIDHIKNHEFFDGIIWGRCLWEQKAPKLKAYVPQSTPNFSTQATDTRNGASALPPPDIAPAHSTRPVHISNNGNGNGGANRPSPRIITELPPPSQLDIEWSPILTRNNERIIKVGQQVVLQTTNPNSPGRNGGQSGNGNTFSRLFGGGGNGKKRQRLVMVTSSGRVLIAAADGNEKKTKYEISLIEGGCTWKKLQDPKGLSYWVIDTVSVNSQSKRFSLQKPQRDRHFAFEDPKASSSDGSATSAAAEEWLEALERAREIAISHSVANSYSGDEFRDIQSAMSSSANTLDMSAELRTEAASGPSRNTLQKNASSNTAEELKGFKRFSKRQSKSGLAAVF
jgi:3-phosphoinositide dependent protein kinase-1